MSKKLDITQFNAVAESEAGFELEMKGTDGADLGFSFHILGRHSDVVQKWAKGEFQKAQREELIAKRKGKEPEPLSLDELKEKNLEGAAIRVTAWTGVDNAFSKDLLRQVLANNPHWIDQIIEASNNDGNFTKANS